MQEERVPTTRNSSPVITKGRKRRDEKKDTGKTAPRSGWEGGKAKRWVNNGHGTRRKAICRYTYNCGIYNKYLKINKNIYIHICIYVCVYFIKRRERVLNFRYGDFRSFIFVLSSFTLFVFRLSFFAVPFFGEHPVNAFREIRFECTHSHTQCCSCVYAIDYFGIRIRGTKGK